MLRRKIARLLLLVILCWCFAAAGGVGVVSMPPVLVHASDLVVALPMRAAWVLEVASRVELCMGAPDAVGPGQQQQQQARRS